MNKKYSIFALLLPAMILTGCTKEDIFPEGESSKETGQLSMRSLLVNIENQEKVISTRSGIDVASFIVEIKDSQDATVESFTYADMPEVVTLPVGNYTVVAHSAENPVADWDTPYLAGSSDFTITAKTVTDAETVTCKLANVRVSVFYDDNLKIALGSDCKVNVKMGEEGSLDFLPSETRSGYFAYVPGSTTLVATLTGTINGTPESDVQTYVDVAPGNHYKITYHYVHGDVIGGGSVNPGNVHVAATVEREDLSYDITVDDDLLTDDLRPGEGGGSSDPGTDPGTDPSTDEGPEVSITAPLQYGADVYNPVKDGDTVVISVESSDPAGIQVFTIDIISELMTKDELEGVGLTDKLNLAESGQYTEVLEGLGIPCNVKGQASVNADISSFMGLLAMLGNGTHTFKITVGDATGTKVRYLNLVI